jgi:glycosyltransferase involved in cell wall biosynthesis
MPPDRTQLSPSAAADFAQRVSTQPRPTGRVTIITVVLNGAPTLGRAIESVLGQSYAPIDYVVIDGGSTDGTLEVILRYAHRLAYWISEPDRGISDAFNKGLAVAGGDFVGLLNADDWLEPDQVERAIAALQRTGADFAFGDLVYHEPGGRAVHRIKGDPDYARSIRRGMPAVNHPTMLVRRGVYQAVGGFALGYRYSMDYDWLLRAHRAGFRGIYEPKIAGHMSLGGACDENYRRARAEGRDIAIRHGLPVVLAWLLYLFRIVKGGSRRALERLAPAPIASRLRSLLNRSYQPDA